MDSPGGEKLDKTPVQISPHVAGNIDRILSAIRRHLGMDIAFVSEFLGANRIFRNVDCADGPAILVAGTELPMSVGYCAHIVAGRLPELIPDTNADPLASSLPETAGIPIGAHLSVPIRMAGERVFGTFCCFSYRARPDLSERELDLMRTFGAVIAAELAVDIRAEEQSRSVGARLRAALAKGDPHMVFQPIVDIHDLAPVAVEALARFSSLPLRGPDLWFGDAHESGLTSELELLAARKALEAGAALPPFISVGVNLSPSTLLAGGVAAAVSGFDPNRLVIEVTEHAPIHDYAAIVEAFAPLRAAGIRIAIDDAGAGYSSLRHVLTLRPDIIKFDISLTAGINGDPMRRAMVAALSEFGARTGTVVVAEGVETEEELATLRGLKVARAQGFLFGRPVPVAELPDFVSLRQERARRS